MVDRTAPAIVSGLALWFDAGRGGWPTAQELSLQFKHEERQTLIESARDGLSVLLSLLLGFSLPMALPHYEQRRQLVVDEANAIATVDQRAQMLPEPFRDKILQSLREYVDARIECSTRGPGSSALSNGAWRDCDWV